MTLINTPSWHGLRGIGRSPVSRLTILVPIIGTFILFSSSANNFLMMSSEFMGLSSEEALFVTRRNSTLMYFGLIIFSVSTLAYNIFCPDIIKEFINEYDFYNAEIQIITKERAASKMQMLRTRYGFNENIDLEIANVEGEAARAVGFLNNANESRDFWLKAKSNPVSNLLQKQYFLENSNKIWVRRSIFWGYITAFILIGVPSAITLWKVFKVTFLQ